MNAFESLIAEFSEKTGLEIVAGADGSVEIEADGVFVTAQPREQSGDVVMFALPLYDEPASEAMMRRALELSAHGLGTDGFFLGLADGSFVLSCVRPLEGLGAEDFAVRMLALSRASRRIARELSGALAEEVLAAASKENEPLACNLDTLRV